MMKPKKPIVGPATKKEAKKATPKVPMTPAGTAAKKKERMKNVAGVVGTVGAAVGSMLADARFQRGADRVRGGRANIKVSPKDAWAAGKNKKATKKKL